MAHESEMRDDALHFPRRLPPQPRASFRPIGGWLALVAVLSFSASATGQGVPPPPPMPLDPADPDGSLDDPSGALDDDDAYGAPDEGRIDDEDAYAPPEAPPGERFDDDPTGRDDGDDGDDNGERSAGGGFFEHIYPLTLDDDLPPELVREFLIHSVGGFFTPVAGNVWVPLLLARHLPPDFVSYALPLWAWHMAPHVAVQGCVVGTGLLSFCGFAGSAVVFPPLALLFWGLGFLSVTCGGPLLALDSVLFAVDSFYLLPVAILNETGRRYRPAPAESLAPRRGSTVMAF